MKKNLHLFVVEMNQERAKDLRTELAQLPQVTIHHNYADAVTASGGLDAVFVSLVSALEWGVIRPPVPLHQTQVVKMPDDEIALGRPQYAIPGIATNPGELLDPVATTRLVLMESFKAIRQFNEANPTDLELIAAAAGSLGLDRLRPGEALSLLSESYLSFFP